MRTEKIPSGHHRRPHRRPRSHQVHGAVTFGFPWKQSALIRRSNDYVLEAVGRFPQRLAGFVCLNPELPDTLEETERCLRAGMKGMGNSPSMVLPAVAPGKSCSAPWPGWRRPGAFPCCFIPIEPVGHLYPGKERLPPWDLYELIRSFPETKFILAHWGGGLWWYQLLKREVREAFQKCLCGYCRLAFSLPAGNIPLCRRNSGGLQDSVRERLPAPDLGAAM